MRDRKGSHLGMNHAQFADFACISTGHLSFALTSFTIAHGSRWIIDT